MTAAARGAGAWRRAGLVFAFVLSAGLLAAPIAAPAQGPACASFPSNSPMACNVQPLDAPRPPVPKPDDPPSRPLPPPQPPPQPPRHVDRDFGSAPSGTVGRDYRAPLPGLGRLVIVRTAKPQTGLAVNPDGVLSGRPQVAGDYEFRVLLRDAARPKQVIRGVWRLHVEPVMEDRADPGTIVVYSLSTAQLKALDQQLGRPIPAASQSPPSDAPLPVGAAPAAPGTAASADSTKPVAAPPPSKISVLLAPIAAVEYPSRALFVDALHYYLRLYLSGAADAPQKQALIDTLATRARQLKPFGKTIGPWTWADTGGCRCVRPLPGWGYRTIYGFLPFWRGGADPRGAKDFVAPQIDFSLFDRIGLLGVQIGASTGSWTPGHSAAGGDQLWSSLSSFASKAQAHGTGLDLVLEGSDWRGLPGPDASGKQAVDSVADAAATQAVKLAEAPMTDGQRWLRGRLAGFWHSPDHVFSGITVMFRPPPPGSPDDAKFQAFFRHFVPALISGIQRTGREYTLNIVMDDSAVCKTTPSGHGAAPDAHRCEAGAFAIDRLVVYRKLATTGVAFREPQTEASSGADSDAGRAPIRARPIAFNLLVMVGEPTRDGRKALQSNIDRLDNAPGEYDFEGAAKHQLMRSIIPILFGPGTGEPPPVPAPADVVEHDDIDNQLAYANEVFGGVGFWPVPAANSPAGAKINAAIASAFFTPPNRSSGHYDDSINIFWCSLPIRLLWQAMMIVTLFAGIAYLAADLSDRTRRYVALTTVLLGIADVALFFGLLYTDPALYDVREGNVPLAFLALLVAVTVLIGIAKPSIRKP